MIEFYCGSGYTEQLKNRFEMSIQVTRAIPAPISFADYFLDKENLVPRAATPTYERQIRVAVEEDVKLPPILALKLQQMILNSLDRYITEFHWKVNKLNDCDGCSWAALGTTSQEVADTVEKICRYSRSQLVRVCGTTEGCEEIEKRIQKMIKVGDSLNRLRRPGVFKAYLINCKPAFKEVFTRSYEEGRKKTEQLIMEMILLESELNGILDDTKEVLAGPQQIGRMAEVETVYASLLPQLEELTGKLEPTPEIIEKLQRLDEDFRTLLNIANALLSVPGNRPALGRLYSKGGILEVLRFKMEKLRKEYKEKRKMDPAFHQDRDLMLEIRDRLGQIMTELFEPIG